MPNGTPIIIVEVRYGINRFVTFFIICRRYRLGDTRTALALFLFKKCARAIVLENMKGNTPIHFARPPKAVMAALLQNAVFSLMDPFQ